MNSLSENSNQMQSEFQQNLDLLRTIDFFAELPMETLKVLAYLCSRNTIAVGETLFSQGEDDGQAFFILSGTIELFRSMDGGDDQPIRQYSQDSFIGGLSLLGNLQRLFTAKATTEVTVLRIEREKFTKAIEQFPEITTKILAAVLNTLEQWEKQTLDLKMNGCPSCKDTIGVTLL